MQNRFLIILVRALLVLATLSSALQYRAYAADDTLRELCVTFGLTADNTYFPPSFAHNGFTFKLSDPNEKWFVNETDNSRGLQFPDKGINVVLPHPASRVSLRLGTYHSKVVISTLDKENGVVGTTTVPHTNSYADVILSEPNIVTIAITGGGSEGLLSRVCIDALSPSN